MKKSLFISIFCVILTFTCIMCALNVAGNNNEPPMPVETQSTTQIATEPATTKIESKKPIQLSQGDSEIIAISKPDEELLTKWTSSDEKVVCVDSGGRVDALKKGKATISAHFSDNRIINCEVTVVDAKKVEKDIFTTSISDNLDVLKENIYDGTEQNPYAIYVNRKMNCVTVYTYDENGEYTIPVRAMISSCGKNNATITGEFDLYFKNEWQPLYENVYGHYTSGISGDFLFHSVPYHTPSPDDLKAEEYNKLGEPASLGCVRLAIADTKWIYENCPKGTYIKIYDDDNPGPLGKPESIKITDLNCKWDPTDDNKENPYYKKRPQIKGVEDCTIKVGGIFSPLVGVKAFDTCSNDITDKLTVTGNVITSRAGKYKVTYSVTDVLNRTTLVDVYITVEEE